MPRLRALNPAEVSPDVGQVFDRFQQVRGNIPNMFRTLARRPEIMITMETHMNAVLNKGTVSSALKELAVVRTSANNKCAY